MIAAFGQYERQGRATIRQARAFRMFLVRPVEPAGAAVLARAHIDAILLSLNGDFADIVSYPPKNYKGLPRSTATAPLALHIPNDSPVHCYNQVGLAVSPFTSPTAIEVAQIPPES